MQPVAFSHDSNGAQQKTGLCVQQDVVFLQALVVPQEGTAVQLVMTPEQGPKLVQDHHRR